MKKITITKDLSGFTDKIKLVRKNNLLQEFVIVDGIGSSGKAMLSHIIASFKRVEKMRLDILFDTIPRLYMLNKISHDAAITVMQIEADMQFYHTMMSRSVNFRFKDGTGVFQNPFPLRYLRRLFTKERGPVIEQIKKINPIFQDMTHDGLRNANILFDAFEKIQFYIIYIARDPVEIIYDWYQRGFGTRIGTDPQEFQFSYEYKKNIVPLYAYGWEKEYLSLEPMDRNIGMIKQHFENNIKSYNELQSERKAKVLFVFFSELVTDPIPISKKIAAFIGTEITSCTKKTLKRENCPRIGIGENKLFKKQFIEQRATKKYRTMLEKLIQDYNTFKYNYLSLEDKIRDDDFKVIERKQV